MTKGNRGSRRCPLCRRQRIRCNEDCEFGQYFPDNMSTEFNDACRLFGMSNLLKLMKSVKVEQRQAAAESILVEGYAWGKDPARGCLGYELDLQSQIASSLRQLENANRLLAFFRGQQPEANQNNHSSASNSIPPQSNLGSSSGMQRPNFGEIATRLIDGMDLMERYKKNKIRSTYEKGESSKNASKEIIIIEDDESESESESEAEAEADEKGKQVIVDKNESKAGDEGEDVASEENTEPKD